jgi:hypothetical protein
MVDEVREIELGRREGAEGLDCVRDAPVGLEVECRSCSGGVNSLFNGFYCGSLIPEKSIFPSVGPEYLVFGGATNGVYPYDEWGAGILVEKSRIVGWRPIGRYNEADGLFERYDGQ